MENLKSLPVTEQSNRITTAIDIAPPEDIVHLLYEADKQIFACTAESKGVLQNNIEEIMEKIIIILSEILKQNLENNGTVVLSGCGTSGRLAFTTARTFNERLVRVGRPPVYQYVIAGNDEALLVSKELTEDNPHIGVADLEKVTNGRNRVLYIGITCGLSAAYVAGQLDFCFQNLNRFTPVLIGFNPIDNARDTPIENWDKTFLQVANKMSELEKKGEAFILCPSIGAEPITGSTRMKSGSTTKILLESMFACAHLRILSQMKFSVRKLMEAYEVIESIAFDQVDNLAKLITISGKCLNADGHIYYLSGDDLGIIGMIDASECTPTFGSDINDVRGFIVGGFETLGNKEGHIYHMQFEISMQYFESHVVPLLTSNDLLIFISGRGDFQWINQRILKTDSIKVLLNFSDSATCSEPTLTDEMKLRLTVIHSIVIPESHPKLLCSDLMIKFCSSFFKEIACKWTCNTISTGAHILKGKVFENFMIDIKVRNNKLFYRALSLVEKFGICPKQEAFLILLKSIYSTDMLSEDQMHAPISDHIQTATNQQKIVSTAIIMARQHCTVDMAKQLLAAHPVVRNALAN